MQRLQLFDLQYCSNRERFFFRLVTSVGQTVVSCSEKLDTSGFSQVYLAK